MLERINWNVLRGIFLLCVAVGSLIRVVDYIIPIVRPAGHAARVMNNSILDDFERDEVFTKEAWSFKWPKFFRGADDAADAASSVTGLLKGIRSNKVRAYLAGLPDDAARTKFIDELSHTPDADIDQVIRGKIPEITDKEMDELLKIRTARIYERVREMLDAGEDVLPESSAPKTPPVQEEHMDDAAAIKMFDDALNTAEPPRSVGPTDAGASIGSGNGLQTTLANMSAEDMIKWLVSQPHQLSAEDLGTFTDVYKSKVGGLANLDTLDSAVNVNKTKPMASVTSSNSPPAGTLNGGASSTTLTADSFNALSHNDMLEWLLATPTRLSADEARVFREVFETKLLNSGLPTADILKQRNAAVAVLVDNAKKATTEIDPTTWGMWFRKGWNRNKSRNLQEALAKADRTTEAYMAALADFDAQRESLMGQVIPFSRKGKPSATGEYAGFKDLDILQNGIIKLDGEDGKPIFNYAKAELNTPDKLKVDAEGNLLPDDRYGVGIKARKVYDTSRPLETRSYERLKRDDLNTLLEFLRNPFKTSVDEAIENELSLAELFGKMRRGERLTPDERAAYRSIVKELPPEQVHSTWRNMWGSAAGAGNTLNSGARNAFNKGRNAGKAARTVGKGLGKGWMSGAKLYDTLFIAPTRKLRAFRDSMKDNWLVQAGLFGVDPFGAINRSQSGLGFGARVLGDVGAGGLAYTFTGLPIFGGILAAGADQAGKALQWAAEPDKDDWWITRGFKLPLGLAGTGIRAAQWPFISKKSLYYNWAGYGADKESAQDYINKQQSWSAEAKKAVQAVADRSGYLLSSLPPEVMEKTINNIYDAYQTDPEKFLVSYNYMPQGDKGLIPWTAGWLDYGGEIIKDGPFTPIWNRVSKDNQQAAEEAAALPGRINELVETSTDAAKAHKDLAETGKETLTNASEKLNGNGKNNPLAFLSNMNKNTQAWRNSMANWSAPIGLGPKNPYGATAGGALGGLLVGGAIGALRYALQDPEKMSELERKRRSLLKMMAQYGMYGATAAGAVGGAFDLAAYANNQQSTAPADTTSVPTVATYAPTLSNPFAPNNNPLSQSSYV